MKVLDPPRVLAYIDPTQKSLSPLSLALHDFYRKAIEEQLNKEPMLWGWWKPQRKPRSLWSSLKAEATRRRNKAKKAAVYTRTT